MAAGHPAARRVPQHGDGVAHAERIEHPPLHQVAVRLARHRLEHHADRPVADVGVVLVLAGREAALLRAQREHVPVRGGRLVRGGDHARRVGEEMVQRHRPAGAGQVEPLDVLRHRRVQVERALRDELQREHGGHRLADRADRPERAGRRVAVRAGEQGALGVADGDAEGGRHARREHGRGVVVELPHGARLRHDPPMPALSVQLYSVRDAVAEDLPGTLARLAAMGLAHVEPYDLGDPAALRAALDAAGLDAPSAHARLDGDDLERVLDAAATVGVGTLVHPSARPRRGRTRAGSAPSRSGSPPRPRPRRATASVSATTTTTGSRRCSPTGGPRWSTSPSTPARRW